MTESAEWLIDTDTGKFSFEIGDSQIGDTDRIEQARKLAREYKVQVQRFQAWASGETDLIMDKSVDSDIAERYEEALGDLQGQSRVGAMRLYEQIEQLIQSSRSDESNLDPNDLGTELGISGDLTGGTLLKSDILGYDITLGKEGEDFHNKICHAEAIHQNKEAILDADGSQFQMFGRLVEVMRANYEHKALHLVALMASGSPDGFVMQLGNYYDYTTDFSDENGFLRQFAGKKYWEQLRLINELTSLFSFSNIGTQFLADQASTTTLAEKVSETVTPGGSARRNRAIFPLENVFYPPLYGSLDENDFVNIRVPSLGGKPFSGSDARAQKRNAIFHGRSKGFRLKAVNDAGTNSSVQGISETLANLAGIFLPGIKHYIRTAGTTAEANRGQQMLLMVYRKFTASDKYSQNHIPGPEWQQHISLIDRKLYKDSNGNDIDPGDLADSAWSEQDTIALVYKIEKTVRKTHVNADIENKWTGGFTLIENVYKVGLYGYAWYNGDPQGFKSARGFMGLATDTLFIAANFTESKHFLDWVDSFAAKFGKAGTVNKFLDSKVAKFCTWADKVGWKVGLFGVLLSAWDVIGEIDSADYDAAAALGASTLGTLLWVGLSVEVSASTASALPFVASAAAEGGTIASVIGATASMAVTVVAGVLIIGGTIAYVYYNDPPVVDWVKTTYFGRLWGDNDFEDPGSDTFLYEDDGEVNWNRQLSTLRELITGDQFTITKCRYKDGYMLVEFEPNSSFIRVNNGDVLYVTSWITGSNSIQDRDEKWNGIVHRLELNTKNVATHGNWIEDPNDDLPIQKFGEYDFGIKLFSFKQLSTDGSGNFLAGRQRLWMQVHPTAMETDARYGLVGIDTDTLSHSGDGGAPESYVELIHVPSDMESRISLLKHRKRFYLNEDYGLKGFSGTTRARRLINYYGGLGTPSDISGELANFDFS
ncbi:hypothetical protein [Haloarchaeobius baliensis]|uniref:hypothetical protein n=1 Tax=Haloarchaeobius baliensis TaxID=1670458 RepID=UPI003F883FC2